MIWEKDNFIISSEKKHVDIDALHDMLNQSYWAKDRSREDVEKSVANSLCFSLLKDEEQKHQLTNGSCRRCLTAHWLLI